ncbi:DNA (cytosine-5-)-methyltransferase [Paenibacillus sp. P22]|uniref:DNA (cytosine-5-)-methyltransferase n=1 Tax=Paenibacillus sp. P22 TaxID=483908 RepID=UPI0003901BDD|nr:DNA (cytosine-5-)-methyltransferase [Paenibacillus sp. P22]CDN42058.1 Modification methylase Rho11sI [Paenibacillus sp. P22]
MTFKYIELFAGIGGFRSALDPLGGECVFASEIDPFATKSYRALYSGATELHGDITQIGAADIPDFDVLVGGFPCQAFSVAGQRKGFEDARGTLFFEIARIAAAKQPRLMLLENVKGLLSHDGGRTVETMAAVLNHTGYAIDFNVLNSKYFGVPQNRERIFIVASRDAEHADWDIQGSGVVAKSKRRIQALGIRTFNFDWPANSAVMTRLRDILEANVDERYYLSEEKTARLIAQLNERGLVSDSDDCEMIGHVDGVNGHDICRRVYTPTGVAPTIPTGTSGNTTPKIAEFTVLQKTASWTTTVKFDETGTLQAARLDKVPQVVTKPSLPHIDGKRIVYGLDGISYYYYDDEETEIRAVLTPDREETRQEGRRFKGNDEAAFTLNTQDKHGIAVGKFPRYRIRKLTPLECWRLQGFTDAQHATAATAGVSDSQRYKQAGNAVTVNVIRALGERLVPLLTANSSETGNRSNRVEEAV